MDVRILIYLVIFLQFTACGKSSSQSEETAKDVTPQVQLSPEIPMKKMIHEDCLNLEKLVSYINQDDFHFPARQTTIDLSYNWQSDLFFAYNVGYKNFQLSLFPRIRSVKQTDCSSVLVKNTYGRILHYKIEQATEKSLLLVRDESAEEEETSDDVKKIAQLEEPELQSIEIILESPLSLLMKYETETSFFRCSGNKKYAYKKSVRYHWAHTLENLPKEEQVDENLMLQINEKLSSGGDVLASRRASSQLSIEDIDNIQSQLKTLAPVNTCAGI